ncbi:YncE family protein [Promicromonospora sp. MS192]|uniref:YncE family protein n=1 Tax=Promicromonospora sp. MS192 TaxID=3412684 RepID=UPI003C2EA3E9
MSATPTRRATPPVRARTTGPRAAHPRAARRPTRRAIVTAWALAGALLTGCATTSPGADPEDTPVDGPGTQQATPHCDATPGAPKTTADAAPSTDAQDETSDSAGTPCEPASATDATTPAPEQHLLLATQADGDSIALVDPRDRDGSAVVDEITVGAAPWDVAVHPGSGRAFVSTAEGVAVVDLATRERTHLLAYRHRPDRVAWGEYRPGGLGLAVSPDGATVHVAVSIGDAAFLETIDVDSGTVERSTPVGRRPFDVLISDDGSEIYTIDHDGFTVTVVDTATSATRSVEVAPFGTEGGLASFEKPHYAVLTPDGDLLLPYQGRALARVDPASGRVTTTALQADTHQHGVARTDDGTLVIAGNGPFGNAASGASIEVVAPDGRSVVLPTDRRHETVAVWQDGGAAFGVLAGGYTQDGAWDGLTVLPLAAALDGTDESYEVEVPGRPQAIVPITLPSPSPSPPTSPPTSPSPSEGTP